MLDWTLSIRIHTFFRDLPTELATWKLDIPSRINIGLVRLYCASDALAGAPDFKEDDVYYIGFSRVMR